MSLRVLDLGLDVAAATVRITCDVLGHESASPVLAYSADEDGLCAVDQTFPLVPSLNLVFRGMGKRPSSSNPSGEAFARKHDPSDSSRHTSMPST